MITIEEKYEIYKKLNSMPILFFEDYLISRSSKLYYLNKETGEVTDISHIIFNYTKHGIPIYRIINYNTNNVLELPLDKIILNTFIGDLDLTIIHKDYDYKNCKLENLKYDIDIHRMNNNSLWIGNKEFKPISEYENYYISNDGMIYSTYHNKLISRLFTKALYLQISIERHSCKIHRLVYSTWVGQIPEGYTINHKNGNKSNNYYDNLEAITDSENRRHAHNYGLDPHAKWNEEDIHIMCQMMENNKSSKDICVYFNIIDKKERKNLQTILSSIRIGEIWKDISFQYKIDNYDSELHKKSIKLTIEQVHEICGLLEKGIPLEEISDKFKVSIDNVEFILNKKIWKDISKDYNFENYNTKLNTKQVHEICKLLDNNVSIKEISNKLGISKNIIHHIKYGKCYKRLSQNYNFLKAVS